MPKPSDYVAANWGQTNLSPVVGVLLLGTLLATIGCKRSILPAVILPLVALCPVGQRIVLFDVDFSIMRLIGLAVLARAVARSEVALVSWGLVDLAATIVALMPGIAAFVRSGGAVSPMAFGMGIDFFAYYLAGRIALATATAWSTTFHAVCWLTLPIVLLLVYDRVIGRNFLFRLGGVPEFTTVRNGSMRAQGPFPHPIMAGCWLSIWMPGIYWLARNNASRLTRAVAGCSLGLSVVGVGLVGSSTAMGGLIVFVASLAAARARYLFRLWPFAILCWAALGLIVPGGMLGVLFLRVPLVSGGTGEHRYRLYNAAIDRFAEWAMIGCDGTSHWGWHLYDVTSEYIATGVRGGIAALAGLVVVMVAPVLKATRYLNATKWESTDLAYLLAVSVAVQMLILMGVTYFGQPVVLLGLIPGGLLSYIEGRRAAIGPRNRLFVAERHRSDSRNSWNAKTACAMAK